MNTIPFKMVKVGAGKYNFVYVGLREQVEEVPEKTLLEIVADEVREGMKKDDNESVD